MFSIKKYAVNTGILLASVTIALLISEGILRLIGNNYEPPSEYQFRHYYKPDILAGYDIEENCQPRRIHIENNIYYSMWSNELGCFDKKYEGDSNYILLVGDSFTHSCGEFEEKWGTLIENSIGMRVLKCGVGGYGTRQELLKAKKIMSSVKKAPRLIVIGYFMNDLYDDWLFPNYVNIDGFRIRKKKIVDYETGAVFEYDQSSLEKYLKDFRKIQSYSQYDDEYSADNSSLKKIPHWIWYNSAISGKARLAKRQVYSALKKRMTDSSVDEAVRTLSENPYMLAFYSMHRFPWIEKAWHNHMRNLLDFKDLADSYGTKVVVVIIPTKEQVYPHLATTRSIDIEQPNQILKEYFNLNKIEYIELLPSFRKYATSIKKKLDSEKDLYLTSDIHWSKKGDRLAALVVTKEILEKGIIQTPDRSIKMHNVTEELNGFH